MKNLELRSDSKTFADWKSPSIPLFMDVYVFNWTNPESIKIAGIKPHFQQLGPYRFQEVRDKLKINFSDDKSEVSYREISHYYFLPEESNGTMDDMFTTVNLIALGAVSRAQYWNFFKQKSVSISLKTFGQEIHITKSIREMLFDGYEDSMLSFGKIFENDTPFTKAGLMIEKNGTDILSGNFTTFTGTDDISKLGLISKLNNTNENSYFEGECKKIKGSTGEFYPPNIKINKPIELFQQKLCRSLTYEYEKDVEVQGILGHRFSLGERAVDNGTVYAENKCFQIGENLPSGLLNISICNYDFPMFMSYPHFYMADESYLEAVEGLTPNKNLHESFMSLEPVSCLFLQNLRFHELIIFYGFISNSMIFDL
jgi:scavenger receptor class B, member 1